MHKEYTTSAIYSEYARLLQLKSINLIHHISLLKRKIKINRCKNASDKTQHLFMIKTLSKLGIEEEVL